MSIFLETNHLFLRSPEGGVTGVDLMKEAGFGAIFCNVKDFAPAEWQAVRDNAAKEGVVCGPWSRMCSGEAGSQYDRMYLDNLLAVADAWGGTPYIVNGEDELNHHDEHSREIVEACGDDDWALSMIAWPFNDNDWTMFAHVPVLPQLFGPEYGRDALAYRQGWQARGVSCVVHTFGTYSGWGPELYPLDAPFGLYTADDCGGNYARWSATGTGQPCTFIPPTNGGDDDMEIGYQHGITAAMNRLRDLDPGGTVLKKEAGKWPSIDTLTTPPDQWKAYDKLERTLLILKDANDANV